MKTVGNVIEECVAKGWPTEKIAEHLAYLTNSDPNNIKTEEQQPFAIAA